MTSSTSSSSITSSSSAAADAATPYLKCKSPDFKTLLAGLYKECPSSEVAAKKHHLYVLNQLRVIMSAKFVPQKENLKALKKMVVGFALGLCRSYRFWGSFSAVDRSNQCNQRLEPKWWWFCSCEIQHCKVVPFKSGDSVSQEGKEKQDVQEEKESDKTKTRFFVLLLLFRQQQLWWYWRGRFLLGEKTQTHGRKISST